MPLGDWATWVQSAATVGALAAAVVAALVAQKVYKIESDRDERAAGERRARAEAERQAQADKVAAWYTTWNPQPRVATSSIVGGAVVKNSSDLPVFDVRVAFWAPPEDPTSGKPPAHALDARLIRAVPPRGEVKTDDELFSWNGLIGSVGNDDPYIASIEFRDAAGIRWRRDIYGKLAELEKE